MKIARSRIRFPYKVVFHRSYIPKVTRLYVLKRDRYTCVFCGKITKYLCHDLTPCRGGVTKTENLLTCCRSCSWKKGEATAKEFREELERKGQAGLKGDESFKVRVKKLIEERKSASMVPRQLGMFTEKMTLNLNKEVKEELRRLGAKKGKTVSGILRDILSKHLKDKYRLLKAKKAVPNVVTSTRNVKREGVSLILDSDMKRKLERLATKKRGSISDIVGELLREYLKNK